MRPYRQNPRPFRSMASRPLLSQQDRGDQQVLRDTTAADRFRNLDELTDSEEDAMSESEDESHVPKKARVSHDDSPTITAAPKWSNPDPYTALPPATEGTGKRTDVLKLIRKAKVANDKEKEEKNMQDQDFISFDFDDDDLFPTAVNGDSQSTKTPIGSQQFDGSTSETLGKRKRNDADAMPRPPRGYLPPDQLILPDWIAPRKKGSTPWLDSHSPRDLAGIA